MFSFVTINIISKILFLYTEFFNCKVYVRSNFKWKAVPFNAWSSSANVIQVKITGNIYQINIYFTCLLLMGLVDKYLQFIFHYSHGFQYSSWYFLYSSRRCICNVFSNLRVLEFIFTIINQKLAFYLKKSNCTKLFLYILMHITLIIWFYFLKKTGRFWLIKVQHPSPDNLQSGHTQEVLLW